VIHHKHYLPISILYTKVKSPFVVRFATVPNPFPSALYYFILQKSSNAIHIKNPKHFGIRGVK
jgi:hypothetical protein